MDYFPLAAKVLLYALTRRQDSTYKYSVTYVAKSWRGSGFASRYQLQPRASLFVDVVVVVVVVVIIIIIIIIIKTKKV